MVSSYNINASDVTYKVDVFDGSDMIREIAHTHNVSYDEGDSLNFGNNLKIRCSDLLKVFRYCVKVTQAWASCHFYMCSNEIPSSMKDEYNGIFEFCSNRYTTNPFRFILPTDYVYSNNVIVTDGLTHYELLYGLPDSYYRTIMERLSKVDKVYVIDKELHEIKSINILRNDDNDSHWIWLFTNHHEMQISVRMDGFCPFYHDRLRLMISDAKGDELLINHRGLPLLRNQSWRGSIANDDYVLPVFLTEDAANTELHRIVDTLSDEIIYNIRYYKREIQKLNCKLQKLRRI